MSYEKKYCGQCGTDITNDIPMFFDQGNLCSSCRDKVYPKYSKAKSAYDSMDDRDKSSINFNAEILEHIPSATTRRFCSCGTELADDEYGLCWRCKKDEEIDSERRDRESQQARKRFGDSLNNW